MPTATEKVAALLRQFNELHEELLAFVQACTATSWRKITVAEGWPVGVTARHIGVAHYPVIEWVQMIVQGNPLPPVTMNTIDQLNAQHAEAQRDCTQPEVVALLQRNHAKVIAYLQTIEDADLERHGYLKLFDADVSAAQLFAAILLNSVAKHLDSMEKSVRQTV
jgi:hypothetical protein